MTSLIQFRMESEDKEVLEALLKDMGLDLGTAFRIFAQKVLKTGKIPFEISSNMDFDTLWTKEDEKAHKKALKDLENGESISLDELKGKYL
ncbi:type II toxin-antitoxin system RelB/DinJ family antitoxin [Campylobacter upsaliensis]|uniref:type II toxin-antitoxin system RelB/DinJ family antitoxin n=1 Tax=Campylobacter upsaliensis TaxID=28080 RepID=UPI00214A27D5|nr:type II toxin-antitoxin system RelB/DinJ family antitoxin [Campylobacter upsaliensis]MCR2102242.1 type II toxin-antitoxin system RelB/DinJ family antitoxin [Campylobacter upsaliensis]